jgi:hypothetical protein
MSNRFAFVLVAACLATAGAGGYFAMRQNAAPVVSPAAAAAAPAAASQPAVKVSERPVATESVVGEKDSAPPTETAEKTGESASRKSSGGTAAERVTPRTPVRAPARTQSADARTVRPDPPVERMAPVPVGPPPAPIPPAGDMAAAPIRPDDRPTPDAAEPPANVAEVLVIGPDSVIGLQIDRTITSSTARVEDRVDARVTRDVRVGEKVAIPSGARAIGSVTEVERGGKFKDRARLGIRFHTLVLADGTRVPMSTETIYRDGDPPEAAQKVGGGAVAGAILGAILGGAKGAAVGGAVGAGAGAAATANGDRSAAVFPAGTQTTVRILSPVNIIIER